MSEVHLYPPHPPPYDEIPTPECISDDKKRNITILISTLIEALSILGLTFAVRNQDNTLGTISAVGAVLGMGGCCVALAIHRVAHAQIERTSQQPLVYYQSEL